MKVYMSVCADDINEASRIEAEMQDSMEKFFND